MSKVISFSISDRYLDKLRSLYPALTDNLAAKQFLTDRLESSLGNSLDANLCDSLDGKLKSLIESELDDLLDERLDATVGKLITSLSDRLSRLEERLDDSLDGRLDDSLDDRILTLVDSRLNESIARLASCLSQRLLALEKRLDDMEQLLRLQRESSLTSPLPTIEKTSPLPPPAGPAIGTLTAEVPPSPPDAIKSLPTVETDSSIETVASAIETDDREWLTLQQVADKKIKGLPGTHQGLRLHAKNWESRKNPTKQGKQYKIPKEYL
ncbi:hypothetical protein [Microcystis sp.]|uniref:hypothetical protein n=1 Tax=Microcystis sp. TaxID=1127 RepID=UPI00391D197E